jgi:hypothetical protein
MNITVGTGAAADSMHDYAERSSGEPTFKSITLTANNTTASVPIFTLTGNIKLIRLYATVTTVLSSNITACSFDLYDTNAAVQLTKNDGVLSNHPVGSWVGKIAANTVTFAKASSAACAVTESANPQFYHAAELCARAGAATTIRLTYTCNNQSSGVLLVGAEWRAINGGTLVAV